MMTDKSNPVKSWLQHALPLTNALFYLDVPTLQARNWFGLFLQSLLLGIACELVAMSWKFRKQKAKTLTDD